MSFQTLFEPLTFAHGPAMKNRFMLAPLTNLQSHADGRLSDDEFRWLTMRAQGGFGLTMTCAAHVQAVGQGFPGQLGVFSDDHLEGLTHLAAAIKGQGSVAAVQLHHAGARSPKELVGQPVAPSDDAESGARAMTGAEVEALAEAFIAAALRAENAGFDGVEIHGAHGYLVDQFLWERTNRRTDAYGGDLVARTRFAAEIVAAVRASVSPDFPVIFRYSQWKQEAYDARLAETPQELQALLSPLVEAGVDAFHASTRRYWQAEFEGSELNLAGWTKKLTGKPTITVGSVGLDGEFIAAFAGESSSTKAIDDLLDGLEAEEFDLVAVGRALLQDPEWAAKVLDGRFDELKAFEPAALGSLS
jgi:2,4-dienoyl-CoA reductase-like NADH-dependent reductase (Old Yellow Enzyme family)